MNTKIYLKSQNNLKFNFCNRDLLGFRVALELLQSTLMSLEKFTYITVFTKIAKGMV